MADRYWVSGGTGTFNSTTNWSASSGGPSGASVPGTADNAFFNAASGVGTATINVASNCANLVLTGFTGTLNFSNTLSVNGTILNFGTGGYTITGTSNLRLITAMTITSNGTTYTGSVEFPSNVTYTLADNMSISGTTTLSPTGAQTINGNNLNVKSNLLVTTAAAGSTSGTTNIILNGTGTWSTTQTSTNSGQIINNLTINTTGTITISGKVWKGRGTFSYVAGTIIDTGATIVIGGSTSTTLDIAGYTFEKLLVVGAVSLSSNVNAITFGTASIGVATNPAFTLNTFNLNFTNLELGSTNTTTLPTAWTCQNLELNAASNAAINGFSINVNGNMIQSGSSPYTGTTTFNFTGTGTWSRTGTTYLGNALTINTAGTLTFSGGSIGGGIFTYTAGTVNVLAGSILYIKATSTTMNHGSIVFYDVIIGTALGSGSVPVVTLNNKLVCSNSLTLGVSNTAFGGTDSTFDTYDLYFGSPLTSTNSTSLSSTKTYVVRRSLQCTQAPSTFPLTLKSTIAGSQAIFTLAQGATIDVGFLNATDINSSLGRTIYSYRGVFSNTLNWQLLPVDVVSSSSTFVN